MLPCPFYSRSLSEVQTNKQKLPEEKQSRVSIANARKSYLLYYSVSRWHITKAAFFYLATKHFAEPPRHGTRLTHPISLFSSFLLIPLFLPPSFPNTPCSLFAPCPGGRVSSRLRCRCRPRPSAGHSYQPPLSVTCSEQDKQHLVVSRRWLFSFFF